LAPHDPEQHAALQAYAFAALAVHVVTVPAMMQLRPPPGGATRAQVPACVDVAPTQLPPQQSSELRHASPFCRQYEVVALHFPPMQPFEQHWLSWPGVHVLPDARHALPLFDAQTPPEHRPLQQSALVAQAALMSLQAAALHTPVAPQKPEQHCEFAVHFVVEPVVMHGPETLPHLLAS
jgi:hypothetical protein